MRSTAMVVAGEKIQASHTRLDGPVSSVRAGEADGEISEKTVASKFLNDTKIRLYDIAEFIESAAHEGREVIRVLGKQHHVGGTSKVQ
jgi:hypothetical protein